MWNVRHEETVPVSIMLYSIRDFIQGEDIKFLKFSQIKNDVQVYESMAGLFPSHVKEDFCTHFLAHPWILSWILNSGSTESPICLILPSPVL